MLQSQTGVTLDQRRRFSVADLEAMVAARIIGDDERLELINGDIIAMSPKGRRHETLKIALAYRWIRACPPNCMVAQETGFRPTSTTYLEPDFLIYPAAIPAPDVSAGDILLLVEISDASLNRDLTEKADLYAVLGVREYWVIDAVQDRLFVLKDPSPAGYRSRVENTRLDPVTPSFAPAPFTLRLADLK